MDCHKNKIFSYGSIIPDKAKTIGVVFGGEGVNIGGDVLARRYNTSLISAVSDENLEDRYKIYMGPMDYSVLSEYNNGLIRSDNESWLVRNNLQTN